MSKFQYSSIYEIQKIFERSFIYLLITGQLNPSKKLVKAQTGDSRYAKKTRMLHSMSRSAGHRVWGFEIDKPKPW